MIKIQYKKKADIMHSKVHDVSHYYMKNLIINNARCKDAKMHPVVVFMV